jgi:hypothetical protein
MRGVARSELPGVLEDLIPDLEDFTSIESLPSEFRSAIKESVAEMTAELQKFKVSTSLNLIAHIHSFTHLSCQFHSAHHQPWSQLQAQTRVRPRQPRNQWLQLPKLRK